MDFRKIRKYFKNGAFLLAALALLALLTACQSPDASVGGEYANPYTKAEIESMLKYHGALVARFDGKQWYFLSGKRWIKIENGGARQFALAQRNKDNTPSI